MEKKTEHLKEVDKESTDWTAKDESYWKSVMTPLQYKVLRKAGTERAFTGEYADFKSDTGVFSCSACGQKLFDSKTKYDSGTGWPSFYEVHKNESVKTQEDNSLFRKRTEVLCSRCDSHLGHVFDDGPEPTGKRYCINSVCLIFEDEN